MVLVEAEEQIVAEVAVNRQEEVAGEGNNYMPLPKPRTYETKNEFISRCVTDENMKSEYSDKKQRVAICYSIYEEENG